MANSLLTIDMITNEALMVLENQLSFSKQVNRDYDDQFAKTGAKIGDTLNIRKPVRYVTRSGPALQVQNSVETSVPVTLTQQGCDISFSTKDMTLSVDEFSDRFLKPAIASVANTIDYDGLQLYRDVYNLVGTPGTTPNALLTYLNAGVKLDNGAAPNDGLRAVVVNPQAQATLVNALTTIFNPTKAISDQYEEGTMGRAAGFKWTMDQNVRPHTFGTIAGASAPVVATTSVTGATSIALSGLTDGDVINRGDVFTVAGCYSVNPQNRASTGQLQQFVATAAVTAAGGGLATVVVSPTITFAPGAQQNQTVDSLPVATAAVTFAGNSAVISPQNMAFHRDAFTLACADLMMPGGVDMAARKRSKSLNMSMRMVRAYDINNDRLPARIDVLYGWTTMRPELAVRVAG